MAVTSRQIRTTNKGLVTERHALVFDPDATVDELNCEIEVSQIRRRRKGINFESNYSLSTFTHTEGEVVAEESWENVGGSSSLKFLVVQVGDTLYFYDKAAEPISGGIKSFTVDLTSFDASNSKVISQNTFQGATIDGVFVVAHPGCNLFYIEYDSDTDTISTTQIDPKVRDFDWQGDTAEYLTHSVDTNISAERLYDTKNAGWDDDSIEVHVKPLDAYVFSGYPPFADPGKGYYPALTKPWYIGKSSNAAAIGLFTPSDWDKVWAGFSLSGNGHYVLDFFNKNREQYSTGAGAEIEYSRFRTVAAFAGRFWYAGLESSKNSGKILFTRAVRSRYDYEICYQINDPTAEDFSDLLDDDGGVINIPSAYGIKKLYDFGSSLLVFAENGVWQINGVDGVFKATEYSVSKITNFGLFTQRSFVDAGGIPLWWSSSGIHTLEGNSVNNQASASDISRTTIQTFWNNIDDTKKLQVKGTYDEENKKVYWMYPSNSETIDYKYNKFLILDIVNKAFVPWEVNDETLNTSYIVGMSYFPAYGAVTTTQNVTENGVAVTVNGTNVTWTSAVEITAADSQVKFIIRDGDTGKLSIGFFGDTDFVDWGSVDYSSYFSLGYDTFESLHLEKTAISLLTYFERTENGWVDNGDGSYTPANQSGCICQAYWDLQTREPTEQNVYRLKTLPVPDESDLSTFSYPTTLISNRTKIRGGGRILSLKFKSESGKDFRFMGYELVFDRHDQI